ncbi:hypothetical protein CMO91_03530 [Candidatus Woesearchaeota archaeon]|jgi:predicted nucleic acid-binding protein|nr:hypothetical protein [Candidatus Woesearchaeota archaeon]|tara:strand:- start:602 stop:1018 length:417 start_codon:yes stop_codon:yes gene_type:complete
MKYIDANVFVNAILYDTARGDSCRKILGRVVSGQTACTSTLTWDEVTKVLKRERDRKLAAREGERFLQFPKLTLIEPDKEILQEAQKTFEHYHVEPRDAIHAATAVMMGAPIISEDKDFDKIKSVTRLSYKQALANKA